VQLIRIAYPQWPHTTLPLSGDVEEAAYRFVCSELAFAARLTLAMKPLLYRIKQLLRDNSRMPKVTDFCHTQ